jgi:hypothetical protein
MKSLSEKHNIEYASYVKNNKNYNFTEGNHLSKESAFDYSMQIAEWIKSKIK